MSPMMPLQQGPPPMMDGAGAQETMPAGPPPPETMDAGASAMPAMGLSLDPGSLAQIAMQAIAEAAQMDQALFEQTMEQARAEFAARQQQAVSMAMPAMEAILAQLAQGPPETMDQGAQPMPADGAEELDAEMVGEETMGPVG